MPSLFQSADQAVIVLRIQSLRSDSARAWGRMSAAQMLAHCQPPLLVATGALPLKRGLVGILFGRLAKRQLAGPKPFGRDMPTAPEFRVKDERDFAREQQKLLQLVREFGQGGPAGLTKAPHPFFGPMTAEEWDLLQWKHLDHHLRQFGA